MAWPLHTSSGHEYMELNSRLLYETDPDKVIGRSLRAKHCAFWSNYLPKLVLSTGMLAVMTLPTTLAGTVKLSISSVHPSACLSIRLFSPLSFELTDL